MIIRDIKHDDFPSCLKLLKQLTIVGQPTKNIFDKINNNNNYNIYISEINNKIIGMATILIEQKIIHSGGKVGHIEDVVVDKNYRGQNVGQKLIERCVVKGKNEKCYKIILDCDEKNIAFYEKCNFKQHGVCRYLNIFIL